jgi:hypothetical protein
VDKSQTFSRVRKIKMNSEEDNDDGDYGEDDSSEADEDTSGV